MGGFIIYTGPDPSARMHSAFFTGSDAMAELATHNEVAYAKVLDCLETGIKYVPVVRYRAIQWY